MGRSFSGRSLSMVSTSRDSVQKSCVLSCSGRNPPRFERVPSSVGESLRRQTTGRRSTLHPCTSLSSSTEPRTGLSEGSLSSVTGPRCSLSPVNSSLTTESTVRQNPFSFYVLSNKTKPFFRLTPWDLPVRLTSVGSTTSSLRLVVGLIVPPTLTTTPSLLRRLSKIQPQRRLLSNTFIVTTFAQLLPSRRQDESPPPPTGRKRTRSSQVPCSGLGLRLSSRHCGGGVGCVCG